MRFIFFSLIAINAFAGKVPHQTWVQRFCTSYLASPDIYELESYSIGALIWDWDHLETEGQKVAIENELRFRLTQSLAMGERNKIHQALERQ